MYSTFNMVMSIKQFIGFQEYITDKRQLESKEVEALISIIRRTKAYVKKVKASGNSTNKICILISFKSNKVEIKDIELVGIKYIK